MLKRIAIVLWWSGVSIFVLTLALIAYSALDHYKKMDGCARIFAAEGKLKNNPATYEVKAPDGSIYHVTAPASATQEQVLAYAQQNHQPHTSTAPQSGGAMATIGELSAALVKADAAGNTADAKVLADQIRSMQLAQLQGQDSVDAMLLARALEHGASPPAPLSQLTDADLNALTAGDLTKVSDAGLAYLSGAGYEIFYEKVTECKSEKNNDGGWIFGGILGGIAALAFLIAAYILGGSFIRPPTAM